MVVYRIIFFLICKKNLKNNFSSFFGFFFRNSRDHVQPFVLVQFTSLPLEQTVNVDCRAWAPNIQQLSQGSTVRGMVSFSLYRSNKPAPIQP